MKLLHYWHEKLAMPKYDESWHRQDMADEFAEYQESVGIIHTWSELSDVAYTYTRARWSGHTTIPFPLARVWLYVGIIYMLPKYTLRWKFFRKVGYTFDANLQINEVRNPKKIKKLKTIAEKYQLDPDEFTNRATRLMRGRIFLP